MNVYFSATTEKFYAISILTLKFMFNVANWELVLVVAAHKIITSLID